ncbi:HNH endonuclease signature motif containing protein [Ornithinimicrobium cryptoxanthini]|uniref:HNH endonuclease n=1 Tax=Ornithinimicrobium cryptoxanthini TaxID=2934161 RepID=A0ABY4YM09_9MICO|nr:HNH endonuclease signature motif containing protein [Ornithinimicrobium cryptoxanthini]USQ77753.1 HNH endonuclease [Ornithinimicrobium cryptoxanthini]
MSTEVLADRLERLLSAAPGLERGRGGLWRGTWPLPPITPQPVDEPTPEPDDDISQDEAAEQLRAVLARLGVGSGVAEALTSASLACATVASSDAGRKHLEAPRLLEHGSDLLGAIESLTAAAGHLESVVLSAAKRLTWVHGKLLLREKGATSPEELSASQKEKWRSRAKSKARTDIEAGIGWGEGEVRDLVAVANSAVEVLGPVQHSLRIGESSWRLVRSYYRACTGMAHEDGAAIANGFFGTDPGAAVTERLDSAGSFLGGPWRHKEFYRALKREIARVNAQDPEKQKEADAAAKANADTHLMLDENGTGTFMIGTTALEGTAINERIDAAARRARALGDPRSQRQLRCAIATALLLKGTVDLSAIPDDPDQVTIEQSEQLARVLSGLPPATLDVIVPLTTLLGADPEGTPIPAAFTAQHGTTGSTGSTEGPGGPGCTCTCTCGASTTSGAEATAGSGADPTGSGNPPGPGLRGQPCPDPAAHTPSHPDDPDADPGAHAPSHPDDPHDADADPHDPDDDADADDPYGLVDDKVRLPDVGVGEVVGRESLFLSPTQVRDLALVPGSTLYRLLTDPATGRCVERSITAYRFDAAMRAQIIAADRFCRAPGCVKPAKTSQLDHVQEYGTTGGHTCEANAMALSTTHHDKKTKKDVDAIINADRDVTWTTLLGRIYTTKAHDYNQYTKLLTAAKTQIDQEIAAGATPAEAIDAAIYQALSYRPPGSPFEAREDSPGWEDDFTGWDQITLTHTGPDGQRAYRPAPDTTRAEHERHQATRTHHDDASDGDGEQHHEHGDDKRDDGHTGRAPWDEPLGEPPF